MKQFIYLTILFFLSSNLIAGPTIIQVGKASIYSTKTGTKTASGIRLENYSNHAAHKTLRFGTLVKVTNLANNRSTIVKVVDKGPFIKNRIIDLTPGPASKIGLTKSQGVCRVRLEVVK